MKNLCFLIVLSLLAGCQPAVKDKTFNKNAATVAAYLKSFENKRLDYSAFAENFWSLNTMFGASSDTITLAQMKEGDAMMVAAYNFKLLGDSIAFLPGVDVATKMPDGSVRYYAEWQVTKPATDSTAEKVVVLKTYESYDFNEDGKIIFLQGYGDFTAFLNYLNSN
ncbi:MAG TPA: hypothetical protein DIS90_04780 [Cytophagales bacterium]|nr:hypothetical protein [Cytophagales bacterium]